MRISDWSSDVCSSDLNVTLRYGLDWIDGDRNKTYEFFAYDEITGVSDPELVQLYRDNYYLEAANYFLHSASVQFNIAEKYELTVGVQNLFDTAPPRISAVGYTDRTSTRLNYRT